MENEFFQRTTKVVKIDMDETFPEPTPDDAMSEPFVRDTNVKKVDVDGYIADDDASENRLRDAIEENARGPKKVTGDAGSVEQHSLKDQIEAERFLQSKKATQKPGLGIRLHKIAADGTV